jgi:hypothetical protein
MVLPILLLGLAPLGACEQVDGDGTPIDPGAVEGILEILPREVTLTAIGDTARLNPALKTTSGHRVEPDGAVEWSVTNPQVATVNSDGLVSAKGTGQTTIRGKVGQQVDSVIVVVTQKPSRVDASPETSTLTALGSTTQLEAQVFDANGTPIPGASVSWYSTDPTVAEVNNAGRVTARGAGEAKIVASAAGASADTVAVRVKPQLVRIEITLPSTIMRVGEVIQLNAVGRDANGAPLSIDDVKWTSLNPDIATVNSMGSVTARAIGTALITAVAACCSSDTASIVVDPAPDQGSKRNEPRDFVKITERSFSDLIEDGWTYRNGSGSLSAMFSIVDDRTAPVSASKVGRITIPAGFTARGSSSQMADIGRRGWSASDVYVSFWIKFSDNWQGHGSGTNKIFYLTDNSSGGEGDPIFFRAHGTGSNRLHFDVNLQNPDTDIRNYEWDDDDNQVKPSFGQAELVRGRWHHIEVLIRGNTPGRTNGEVHAWVDGNKILQFVGQEILSPGSDGTFDNLRWHPIWGGQHTTNATETMYQSIDHIYLSGRQ